MSAKNKNGLNIYSREEKKVEYLELIYDLIFVYMIGRDNSLLENIQNGFVAPGAFISFAICTLSIIQVWNFTTFYINMFGRNGLRDHIFLLSNMYLMYFIGESTRTDASAYIKEYHVAWGLILANVGLQYLLELRNHKTDVWNRDLIRRMGETLFIEAGMVFLAGFLSMIASQIVSTAAIFMGIFLTFFGRAHSAGGQVDFMHLTERAMLYVVFTFGEMVIAIANYFHAHGKFDPNVIVYSALTFLMAAGLFLSYEVVYEYLVNRGGQYTGMGYMMIHIFIIFALNNVTVAFEFMREKEIALFPKALMMTIAVVSYFIFLFLLGGHFRTKCHLDRGFILKMSLLSAGYFAIMLLPEGKGAINLIFSVVYVYVVLIILYRMKAVQDEKKRQKEEKCQKAL